MESIVSVMARSYSSIRTMAFLPWCLSSIVQRSLMQNIMLRSVMFLSRTDWISSFSSA